VAIGGKALEWERLGSQLNPANGPADHSCTIMLVHPYSRICHTALQSTEPQDRSHVGDCRKCADKSDAPRPAVMLGQLSVSWCVFVQCLYNTFQNVQNVHHSRFFRQSHDLILSNLTRVKPTSHYNLVLWTQSKFSPMPPTMSGSESSSLDEQTLGRLRFFRESAIPQRVPRSIALINQAIATGYALVLSRTFDLIFHLGSTRPFDGGLADLSLLVMADRDDPPCAAWRT
jgi:hypothetical protein